MTKNTTSIIVGVVLWLLTAALAAQDDVAAKEAAVDRYLRTTPISSMLEDTYTEMAKQLPPGQRDAFVSQMRDIVHADMLERIARDSMLRIFTTEELNALADFYGSEHGASAIQKFGIYMADVMPAIQAEMQRAIEELNSER